MSSVRFSRRSEAVVPLREDENAGAGQEARDATDWTLCEGIGQLEEGSLEESIWRELGALPRSRMRQGRR